MIQSMTGFGKAEVDFLEKKLCFEIRSLNSKNLDLSLKTPPNYRSLEPVLRKECAKHIKRGKAEVYLSINSTIEQKVLPIDVSQIESYMQQLKPLAPEANSAELLSIAMRLPGTTDRAKEELTEEELVVCTKLFKTALDNFILFREEEGSALYKDLKENVTFTLKQLARVVDFEDERISIIREKLLSALKDKELVVDQNRYEQEVLYYQEKIDINEEKVRLKKHCEYFIEQLDNNESNGKKLNFICQEMGREINTLGAKANHEKIQRLVISMKEALEKIKEQILNVL